MFALNALLISSKFISLNLNEYKSIVNPAGNLTESLLIYSIQSNINSEVQNLEQVEEPTAHMVI